MLASQLHNAEGFEHVFILFVPVLTLVFLVLSPVTGFMPYTSKLPQYFRDPKLF